MTALIPSLVGAIKVTKSVKKKTNKHWDKRAKLSRAPDHILNMDFIDY